MSLFNYTCSNINAITTDISILTLTPTSNSHLTFTPGQYIEIVCENGAILPLSIANVPHENGHLEIHLRHDSHHPLAQIFAKELIKDKNICLRGPKGQCTLARAKHPQLLFLAGGTGFAPIKALLESAFIEKRNAPMVLYWGIRKLEDAYDEKTLQNWREKNPSFHYQIVLSEPENFPDWQGACGYVHAYLAKHHPNLQEVSIFASGPYPMIKAAQTLFSTLGLEENQLISDMISG